jgi:hypothetical protein
VTKNAKLTRAVFDRCVLVAAVLEKLCVTGQRNRNTAEKTESRRTDCVYRNRCSTNMYTEPYSLHGTSRFLVVAYFAFLLFLGNGSGHRQVK